ncbi:phage tail sheath subtilisin-like domain-containing protein [bacterium]|nr:phage tail sheath subtilisin-like domain-containing protein [bacterium]
MAETLLSPGVLARENDQSQITAQPIQAGAAIIGPTVLGKVNIPTLVTTYSEYLANFGSTFSSASDEYSFLTSISAFNYFQNGGTSLIVTRVASGSFSPATSSNVEGNTGLNGGVGTYVTGAFNASGSVGGTVTGVTASLTDGVGAGAEFTFVLSNSESLASITVTSTGSDYASGEILTFTSESLGASEPLGTDLTITLAADNIQEGNNIFTLETLAEGDVMNSTSPEGAGGTLPSGSTNNVRWEITSPNTARGVFTVIVRQGSDTTKSKSVLESFTNVSLDPKASNYIARVIGDSTTNLLGAGSSDPYLQSTGSYPNASRYIRVKEVNVKTPDYFDNNGNVNPAYTGSIPVAQSGSFGDAVGEITGAGDNFYQNVDNNDTQGLTGANYTDAINLLANQDEYVYNIITTPGLIYANADHATPLNTLIANTENRGDAITVIDLENYGSTITAASSTAASLDTSYAASYWPWVQITDPDTAQLVWVPAGTLIPGVYAYTDRVAEPWFAPAGINRGGLGTVRQAERKLTQANRDTLYINKVNPIATFPGQGVTVFGQKTLQTQASALDRVNVRRLLIALKSYIAQISDNLVFEQNTAATRNQFLSQVNPYLESVQQRQGLYAFKVVMDATNNTPDVIDRNQLIGAIYLQPTKTAEFIYLDFNILPTGATFPS